MTAKQILDSFSETLMQDERILSAQERVLVANLLQHARAAESASPNTHEAVRAVIASAIGETVAQRAFAVLGGSIVERIVESSSAVADIVAAQPEPPGVKAPRPEPQHPGAAPLKTPKQPEPPGVKVPRTQPEPPGVKVPRTEPQHPGTKSQPQHPGHKPHESPLPKQPEPPGRKPLTQPEPPGRLNTRTVVTGSIAAIAERPEVLRANYLVLDEFLAPQEVELLTRFTLEREAEFRASEVYSASAEKGVLNYDHRRSRVLMELGEQEEMILARIKSVLPQVVEKLGMEEFKIDGLEAQITASNDGDFFHLHDDNGSEGVSARHLTFVYFFHREPRQFEGGELLIHDAHLKEGVYVSDGTFETIVPQQNRIVFFPCELQHEITPVQCPSQHFADSRFTLNGWLHR